MNGRIYIKGKITLRGESDGAYFDRTFRIGRVISEGADGICYEAHHEKSGIGVLKEFYPKCAIGTERNADGQLGHTSEFGSSLQLFRKSRAEFLRPYEMLLDIIQNDPESDIASFIPAFEIYYGSSDEEDFDNTVYIWTPKPQLVTFDSICREIHAYPDARPEYRMFQVLSALETLTKCVCSLHSADLIHRDIKPSNFGFMSRGGEILTQAISLFDIDTICSVWAENAERRGTPGYMEPEAMLEDCSNQTDIYSIGATLFNAVAVTPETREGRFIYRDRYFTQLKNMVDSSEFINACESNSHPRLRAMITKILRKSLCSRPARYENCEEMLEDIHEALFYALPYDAKMQGRGRGARWVLADVAGSLDAHADKNSYLQILYHLNKEPLYRYLGEGETELRAAVVGFDPYGQKFLDACIQTGQMRGVKLSVDVCGADAADRDLYLEERPGLAEFFNISGTGRKSFAEDAYGDICFTADAPAADVRYHYAFISLGTDEENRNAAGAFRRAAEKNGPCSVNVVSEAKPGDGEPRDPHTVYVNEDRRKAAVNREIERMAFNTHLVWENDFKGEHRDRSESRKEFRKPYNHDACVAGVVSANSKLYSLGIDPESCSPDEAAARYAEIIEADASGCIRNELMWVEHRRWVTEKLCKGWTRMTDLESCVYSGTKSEKRKQHICIVRSRPDNKLAELTGAGDPRQMWNSLSDEELAGLDELDRLSVELHRIYEKNGCEKEAAACRNWKLADADIVDRIPYILTNAESGQSEDEDLLQRIGGEDPAAWSRLCALLREHSEMNGTLAVFSTDENNAFGERFTYSMPAACGAAAAKLAEELAEKGAAGQGSGITQGAGICTAEIYGREEDRDKFGRIFGNIYALMDSDAVSVKCSEDRQTVTVYFDDLMAKDVPCGSDDDSLAGLLAALNKNGALNALRMDAGSASFTYASKDIKRLLTGEVTLR